MYALIDCNNFFVSCERVRHPHLRNRPVIVLSNNDGCAVAMSNEAKALGIRRGVPLFKIKDVVERHNVAVISGDHRYYSAISTQVMNALSELDLNLEVYSVDEAFLTIPPELGSPHEFGSYIVRKVMQETGIPVSVGIASTRTLAKVAARFAKKYPGYQGCCIIDSEQRRLKALELTEAADVWGIGRRLAPKLKMLGINTARQLADLPLYDIKRHLNLSGERTWRELNGEPCVEYAKAETAKSIMASRSFERDIFSLAELEQAICVFATIVGKKLRRQHGYATQIGVFIATNRFHTDMPQYTNSAVNDLCEASDYTPTLASEARKLLHKIYRNGYGYKRAGVMIPKVIPSAAVQRSLFEDPMRTHRQRSLMQVADRLALANPGAPLIRIAALGNGLQTTVARHNADEKKPDIMPNVGDKSLPFGF